MKYTITRALAELKLLKSRYEKEVRRLQVMAVKHGSKLRSPYSQYKEEDFISQAKEDYQSVCDLERRIAQIKNSIDASNFTTKVMIGDKEMTVQEALNYKNMTLGLKEMKLSVLQDLKVKAQNEYDRAITENRMKVDKMSTDKNASGSTKSAGEVEKDALEFVEKLYAVSMVDPIGIDDEIAKLSEEISEFKHNIDFVLSESNSTTYIEIDD